MIRIFIADDHVMFAEGVESLLVGEPDFALIGKATTAAETLRQVMHDPPDVLLLDINLPDQSGLEVCKQLRTDLPDLKILVLSMLSEESYISAMLGLGAQGYVLKKYRQGRVVSCDQNLVGWKNVFQQGSNRRSDARINASPGRWGGCKRTTQNQSPRTGSASFNHGRAHYT